MNLLKGIPGSLPLSVEGEDGPLSLTGTPTVAVTGPDGLSVTVGAVTGAAAAWAVDVPAQTRLGPYSATFTGTYNASTVTATIPFEVVGGHLFSLPTLRAFDASLDATAYTDTEVKTARAYVEAEFRRISGRSFTPRSAVETVPVSNGVFYVENVDAYRVVAATLGGVAVDVSTVTIDHIGKGGFTTTVTDDVLTVEYEYGFNAVPDDVRRAALLRARTVLADRDSGIPDRAMSVNMDGAQFSLATAGRSGFETGIPEVDAILARYRVRPPGVA